MRRPVEGEIRSFVLTGYFTVPWDFPEERIPANVYLEKFISLQEKQGLRFERVLEVRRDHIPSFNPDGEGRKTYIMRVLFSQPAKKHVLELPDRLSDALLHKYPGLYKPA